MTFLSLVQKNFIVLANLLTLVMFWSLLLHEEGGRGLVRDVAVSFLMG